MSAQGVRSTFSVSLVDSMIRISVHLTTKACVALLLVATSAGATAGAIIETHGSVYEIETVTGLLSTHRSTIEGQVWFGDSNLARDLANELGTLMGTPNVVGTYGPMFAYYVYDGVLADYTKGWVYYPNRFGVPEDNRAQDNNASAGNYYTYAVGRVVGTVAATVPEPPYPALTALAALLLTSRLKGRFARRAG
jgi:hypothetical protein